MANSVDPAQTAPIGAVCSRSTLFASILNLPVTLGNYLQQTTPADVIFRCIFLGALRIRKHQIALHKSSKSSNALQKKQKQQNNTKISITPEPPPKTFYLHKFEFI